MKSMFRISQSIDFCYGHRLLGYDGKCRFLHGHNGRAELTLEGAEVNDQGMVVDFAEIKRSIRTWIEDELDHRTILSEDDPLLATLQEHDEPIVVIKGNPTAENIARLIYEKASSEGFPVTQVALWETPKSCAIYRP
jgi:6-pyruvoyltetrahydropterin/6-carboxytetrahydropterin synthase